MRERRGFTLVELIIVAVLLGVFASLTIPKYTQMVEKGRGAEAYEILSKVYGGRMRLLDDNETSGAVATADLSNWAKLGMTDPGANAAMLFNYVVNVNSATATRKGNASRTMTIWFSNNTLTKSDPY
jgi:prepilin-type N-terminal cleavage/methylation domain-containing protein